MIKVDYGDDAHAHAHAEGQADHSDHDESESKLHKHVQSFVRMICDVKLMKAMLIELAIDTNRMPLGKLSKDQIAKGYKILQMLEMAVAHNSKKDIAELTNQ